ncbi:MAG: GyrI-like domain-containing protein [Clostridiales bacterium]|jgi:predicted transcriptional regulator YdeE|nr:GyrI-like domain-containing protein [Clostridiales bacterium]
MAAEIIKVYKEHLPSLRFIGKRYTNADRVGGFGHKWGEWFEKGWFDQLEKIGECKEIENGYLGFMRCNSSDFDNTFEYWIGMFFPVNTTVPEGFDFIDLQESNVAICWIKGKEDEGIYNMHDACISKLQENGMDNFRVDHENRTYFFERYNCPRFTTPDENGNVILDYGAYLTE